MRRKQFQQIVPVVGVAIMLVCSMAASVVMAEEEVTLRILTRASGADPMAPFMKGRMEAFMELHPNVTFQDDSISEEAAYMSKFKTDLATGDMANMFVIYGSAPLVPYAKNGVLMDLTPLLEDKEWANGFVDPTFAYYNLSSHGIEGIYGIPFAYFPEVIWYNTELFEKAGITEKPETMEDLYAAIEKLKAAEIIPWSPGAKDTWRTGHILNNLIYRTAGVDKFKEIGARNGKWTDPEVVEAFQVMLDLKGMGAFEKNFEGLDYANETAGFFAGKYAMVCNGSWFLKDIVDSDITEKIDFFTFPYLASKPEFKGDSVMFTNGWLFNGRLEGYEKEITMEWAKFLTGKESAQVLFDDYNMMSSRTDTDSNAADKPQIVKDILAWMGTVSNPGGDYFDYDTVPSLIDVSRNNLIGMLLGTMSPQDAAEAIQKEIDRNTK